MCNSVWILLAKWATRWASVTIQQNTWIRYLLRAAFLIYPSLLVRTNDLSLRGTIGKREVNIVDTYFTMRAALKQGARQIAKDQSEVKSNSSWIPPRRAVSRTCEIAANVIACHIVLLSCATISYFIVQEKAKKRLFNFSYSFLLFRTLLERRRCLSNLYQFYIFT